MEGVTHQYDCHRVSQAATDLPDPSNVGLYPRTRCGLSDELLSSVSLGARRGMVDTRPTAPSGLGFGMGVGDARLHMLRPRFHRQHRRWQLRRLFQIWYELHALTARWCWWHYLVVGGWVVLVALSGRWVVFILALHESKSGFGGGLHLVFVNFDVLFFGDDCSRWP